MFTNLLLADEINRTPPKTQAALLEAMEERQVSVEGEPRPLPDPFIVAATQNPIEYEGTYQLPEAQLDRFLLKLNVPLPAARSGDRDPATGTRAASTRATCPAVRPVAGRGRAGRRPRRGARRSSSPTRCSATSSTSPAPQGIPRRCSSACRRAARPRCWPTARAWAWLSGRNYVTPDDVKAMARPTLRHRVALRPEAELEGATADGVLDGILAAVPVPR